MAFADAYCSIVGGTWSQRFDQGIYALQRVRDVPQPTGGARAAGPGDEDTILSWLRPFADEADHEADWDEAGARRRLRSRLSGRSGEGYWLWCDPKPVSMTGVAGDTPSGARIGPVFTPPEHRRQGYATALVAHVSETVLERGKRHCFLYTDMENPTSNAIYQRIGYELSCRSVMLRFEDA
jgi:predicted GNAT family acetyltransferase